MTKLFRHFGEQITARDAGNVRKKKNVNVVFRHSHPSQILRVHREKMPLQTNHTHPQTIHVQFVLSSHKVCANVACSVV